MIADEPEMITITYKEYKALVKKADWLEHLDANGVDNWEWYEAAQDSFEGTFGDVE
jgi:hypothetical protein